jgi:hypothetical protein
MNWTGSTMRMAWRNLWRNRRRTALALAAIGLSVTRVLAYASIVLRSQYGAAPLSGLLQLRVYF